MSDQTKQRDLTSFLLEWRDTCAIDNCPERIRGADGIMAYSCKYKQEGESDEDYIARIREDVAFVHNLTDNRFRSLVTQTRSPDLIGIAKKQAEALAAKAKDKLNVSPDLCMPDSDNTLDEDPDDGSVDSEDFEGEQSGFDEDADSANDSDDVPSREKVPSSSLGRRIGNPDFIPGDRQDEMAETSAPSVIGTRDRIRGQMVSEYLDIVQNWKKGEKRRTHAFHVMEAFTYGKTMKKTGIPFKNHLFEVIAANGSVGKVWGYLYKGVLRTIVDKSFRPVTVVDEDYSSRDPKTIDSDELRDATRQVAYKVGTNEAADALFKWTENRWPRFDINDKIALVCTLWEVSMNDARITALTTVGRQAFYNRKRLARESLESLLDQGFEMDDLRPALAGPFQDIVLSFAEKDPTCGPFLEVFRKMVVEPGK